MGSTSELLEKITDLNRVRDKMKKEKEKNICREGSIITLHTLKNICREGSIDTTPVVDTAYNEKYIFREG